VLSKAVSVKWGVISSSLIFAVIHLHVPAIAPLFIVALACALAYMYTRSLVVPIVMHASFNALNMGMLLLLNG
jgi:membrane protease YdiL (CAAX protease family)